MSESQPLLAARNLAKSYRGRQIISDFSLQVDAGETIGLLGSNGAGKTTSFYILAGLVEPSAGTVSYAGQDITRLPVDKRASLGIGLLPQERSVFTSMSVLDNLRAVLEIRGVKGRQGSERAQELLHDMGVEHLAGQLAGELSGGELRRVEIARALALAPRLLLLDEPFAAIDPITVADLQEVLRKLRGNGIGLVVSDHNVRETLSICDRAYILHAGQLLCEGTPAHIAANEQVRTHYLGQEFRL